MTPRIWSMSVPGRTRMSVPVTESVIFVPEATLLYELPPATVIPVAPEGLAFTTASVTKSPPAPAMRIVLVIW